VARHRSPQGRRTHLGLPLPPVAAAAGAGGALVPTSVGSLAPRVITTLLAGGALAAVGQAGLSHALPVATDGANVLRLTVQELVGTPDAGAAVLPAVDPVATPPHVADVSDLVKAAELHHRAAARPTTSTVPAVPLGDVQMVTGRVTSGFGARWGHVHEGVDIAAPIGTPIRAPLPGEVIASGPATGFGLWVRVRHDDGTVTTYGHVNRSLVHVGEDVTAGEEIAEVGNRGHSTGPHLHMEVQTPIGTTVDPRPWLDGHGIGY
jgi:murein DD-endopeptidase MepM/ murein hydrolase activator NlpD